MDSTDPSASSLGDREAAASKSPPKPRSKKVHPPRILPPVRNLTVATCIWLTGVVIWWFDLFGDHAVGNIALLITSFIAICWPIGWFTLFSAQRGPLRWVPVLTLAVAMIVPALLIEIREVGGELKPRFYWRWTPAHDEQLGLPAVAAAPKEEPVADLSTTSPSDFAQFLGPQRNSYVPTPKLAHDWKTHPPERVWEIEIGAGWSAFSVVNGYAVTMEQRGPQELVTCYDAATGELKWSHGIVARYDTVIAGLGPRATPTIDGGNVYALGGTGILRCIDGGTGHLAWQRDLLQEFGIPPKADAKAMVYGRSNSPLVVGDLVVVPVGGPGQGGKFVTLAAYNKATGEEVWRGGDDQAAYASPTLATLHGVEQILSVNENTVSAHALADGKVLWTHPWPSSSAGDSNNSQPLAVSDNRVFVSKSYGVGSVLLKIASLGENSAVSEIWRNSGVMKTKFCNVVVYDGHVYGLSDGILECINLDTGDRAWKKGRYHHGQILGVGDVLLVMCELTGELVMVELTPDKHRELGRLQALSSEKVWNNLAIVGEHLFVRDATHAACWKLPLAK